MNIAETWTWAGDDECARFFTGCLKAQQPDIPHDARVLEIGCAEFDWLTPASQCWPEMTFEGVDWRVKRPHPNPKVRRQRADVRDPNLFAPDSFDWVVSISAIEHIGLGHYEQDPLDVDGDTVAIANAFRWLKPGGWLFFDVPFRSDRYLVNGTSHREYDADALFLRLFSYPLERAKARARWHGTYYAPAGSGDVTSERPSVPANPFHYVGLWVQKVG